MTKTIVKFDGESSHVVYKTKAGVRVPGASTVAKIGDSPEALIAWAWKLGTEGRDYKKARDSAADIGSVAHFLVECHLAGKDPDCSELPRPVVDRAETAFLHFLDFWKAEQFEPLNLERQLVSEQHGYGGTLDITALDKDGQVVLLDWKSSDRIYQSHLAQLAGYEMLWNEHEFARPVSRRAIVRIPKTDAADFEVRWLSNIDRWWAVFQAQLSLYNAMKNAKTEL